MLVRLLSNKYNTCFKQLKKKKKKEDQSGTFVDICD